MRASITFLNKKITTWFLPVVLLWGQGCGKDRSAEDKALSPGTDSLIQINLGLYVDSLWNARDTALLKQIGSEGFQRTLNGITRVHTAKEMQAHMQLLFTAFPDLRWQADQQLIRQDDACFFWMAEGTHIGTFAERRPTGKKFRITGISRFYFDRQGKILREFVYFNELDLLQQLGYTLLPPVLE